MEVVELSDILYRRLPHVELLASDLSSKIVSRPTNGTYPLTPVRRDWSARLFVYNFKRVKTQDNPFIGDASDIPVLSEDNEVAVP